MILVIDFGSQVAHLIGRRLKDLGVFVEFAYPKKALTIIKKIKPNGIILSGGPTSVYEKGAPTIDKKVFGLGIPILGICYGQQLTAHLLDGEVGPGKVKEYGPTTLLINRPTKLFASLSPSSRVWMSHGDTVVSPPPGFTFVGQTENIKAAAMTNEKKKIYCVQFHPEVEHTEHGIVILKNFLSICGEWVTPASSISKTRDEIVQRIKKTVGNHKAIAAVSGGLDSTVAATLVVRAIGKNLTPVYIDSGLMRTGAAERISAYFQDKLGIPPIIIHCQDRFLKVLKGVVDPEKKRKRIGKLYIDLFEEVLTKHPDVTFLVQGTIYSDVIESKGSRHADRIKSHHNVGGLPQQMKLTLIEPLRELYTDQVRELARRLGIPNEFITEQPHPGPGYAIRIIGEVTEERLATVSAADEIVSQEMKKSGWYEKVLHSFAVATGAKSTALKGDGRGFGEVIAVRAVVSRDRMTADWGKLPYYLLQKISSRIVNEVPGVSRVVYDITTKPPATMEWE